MFRRRWSGLPADPIFPSDFKELGYFINEIDEIRSVEHPDYYFKYYLTKNDRWNERHRFAFNQAVAREIHARLDAENFTIIPLPLGTPATEPHVPVRASANLATASSRVVILFGESCQPLGVLAHRVIGGKGGVARGSVLSFVAALGAQPSSATDPSPPGILLANAGELWWWPEGRCGLTPVDRHCVPMASAVHVGRYHDPRLNEVEGNRTVGEHVKTVFEAVLAGGLVKESAKLDIIAVGDTAEEVEKYLNDDKVWEKVGGKLGSMVVLGGCYSSKQFKCDGLTRFMEERARAYIIHGAPLDTPLAGPGGNPSMVGLTSYGCPIFSAGGAKETETMLIEAQSAVLKWMKEVALKGEEYKNAVVEIFGDNDNGSVAEDYDSWWGTAKGSDSAENDAEAQENTTVASSGKENEAAIQNNTDAGMGKVKDDTCEAHKNRGLGSVGVEYMPSNGEASQVLRTSLTNAGETEAHGEKVKPNNSFDAHDMKELVGEIEDMKIKH
ncbi:hypothetical protein VTI28DRAFT_1187 [Corynascus sepedonium]